LEADSIEPRTYTAHDFAGIYAKRAGVDMKYALSFVSEFLHLYQEILYYDLRPGDKIKLRGLWTQELRPAPVRDTNFPSVKKKSGRTYRLHTVISRKMRRRLASKFLKEVDNVKEEG